MAVSFAKDIVPLFDPKTDIPHMARGKFLLDDFAFMSVPQNAEAVLDRLNGKGGPVMPPPPAKPWSPDKIALFRAWIDGGYQP